MDAARNALPSGREYEVMCVGSCGVVFYGALGIGHLLAAKPFKISSAWGPISTIVGGAVVAASSQAVIKWSEVVLERKTLNEVQNVSYIVGSMGMFRLLGGRFKSVLASDILKPGAFARESIDASKTYATTSERESIAKLGKKYGCHTCGQSRKATLIPRDFHADHQPPLTVAKEKILNVSHRFYPQCQECSGVQATVARMYGGTGKSHFVLHHLKTLRLCHLTGFILGFYLIYVDDREQEMWQI